MKRRCQTGSLSIIVLSSMMIVLLLIVGTAGLTMNSMRRSKKDSRAYRAIQATQAGLEYQTAEVYASLDSTAGEIQSDSGTIPSLVTDLFPGSNGTTTVQPTTDPKRAWVTCTATFNGSTRTLRSFIHARNVSIWNNAIFAGSGASGQAINGNVDIRGSMHLLGDGEPYVDVNGNGTYDIAETFTDSNSNGTWDPGESFTDTNGDGVCNPAEPYNDANHNNEYDPPLTQTELNSVFGGNAYVGNNYSGMPAALEALIPAAPTISGIEQLGTEVRVKHGRISIGGSATIGYNGVVDGGSSKSKVDGVYVNDGFTGNQGSAAVFSDNGTSNAYDLGNLAINFPHISGVGAEPYVDEGNTTWNTHEEYLNARSLTVPVTLIKGSTAAFSYGPDAYGNSITFTPAAGATPSKLVVNGVVKIAGNIQIGAKNDPVYYEGNGTIYSTQDISIRGNFLPRADQTFPTTARVGLIAKRDMFLATGSGDSQLSMAGAFYAQGTIVSAKQNQIAGTFVANYFDMVTFYQIIFCFC